MYLILGILVGLFVLFQIYVVWSRSNIESYSYTVVKKYPDFEIRSYEASLFTSVKLGTSDYKKSSSKGFSILAGYIFGGNEQNEKISMTSPVSLSMDDSMTMMFLVPKNLKKENLPKPNQSQIEFKEEPAKKLAAIRFGGWASDEKLAQYKQKLITALNAQGIQHKSNFSFLGYNAPFDLFFRRNEVVVGVE
ncbi:MAG: heme-binding protein [Crocinitomicaceae bacterium]